MGEHRQTLYTESFVRSIFSASGAIEISSDRQLENGTSIWSIKSNFETSSKNIYFGIYKSGYVRRERLYRGRFIDQYPINLRRLRCDTAYRYKSMEMYDREHKEYVLIPTADQRFTYLLNYISRNHKKALM